MTAGITTHLRARSHALLLALALVPALLSAQEPYEEDWESLRRHEAAPEWFRDVKYGIYFHWGVYSVPAYGSEWYPRNMHLKKRRENRHHVETYGEPTTFGYHDFVPRFKAEAFDAAEWAELFARSGAQFAGPVAEHHDGYAMWASTLTPWNAAETGPKRDLTGELAAAIRARGMRVITSFHHARNNLWEKNGRWTGHYEGVKANCPALLDDPKQAILYGYMPREQFCEMWLGKLKEVIDQYQPDIIWFDSWLNEIPESYQTAFAAHYLNQAQEWGREVVITCKQRDLPTDVAVEDFEKGRADRLTPLPWLTDDTISRGSWCYTEGLRIKPADEVIHVLIDIVSKNGQLLLNISPKADGSIPEDQRAVLLALGTWLDVAGDAIYNTRPWLTFGEGPTRLKKGGHFVGSLAYTAEDIRYTAAKDGSALYATVLGWPEEDVVLRSVKVTGRAPDARVTLLGHEGTVAVTVNEAGQPVLSVPQLAAADRPCAHAYAFKLEGCTVDLHEEADAELAPGLRLTPEKAVVYGPGLKTEERDGRVNLGFWDNPAAEAHWLLAIEQPGTYRFRADLASMAASRVELQIGEWRQTTDVSPTGDWSKSRRVSLGEARIDSAGVHHVVLRAADPATWQAVNVFGIQALPTGR